MKNTINYFALLVCLVTCSYSKADSEMTYEQAAQLEEETRHERQLDANKLWLANMQGKPAPTPRSEYQRKVAAYEKLKQRGIF